MIGWDQYPTNLPDYWKQVRRWNIGFFQTVKKNGIWPSFFWATLGLFSFEILSNSIFLIFLPLFFLALILPIFHTPFTDHITYILHSVPLYKKLTIMDLILGTFLIDYVITVIIGLVNRKPQFIFYGLFFFFMHYITSLILVSYLIPGFFASSEGRWISPKRHQS